MTKGVDEKIDEGVFRWFGHVERMENDRIGKRVYLWIDTLKDCLKKRALDVREA